MRLVVLGTMLLAGSAAAQDLPLPPLPLPPPPAQSASEVPMPPPPPGFAPKAELPLPPPPLPLPPPPVAPPAAAELPLPPPPPIEAEPALPPPPMPAQLLTQPAAPLPPPPPPVPVDEPPAVDPAPKPLVIERALTPLEQPAAEPGPAPAVPQPGFVVEPPAESAAAAAQAPAGPKEPEPAEQCDPSTPGGSGAPPSPTFGFSGATPALGEMTKPPKDGVSAGIGVERIEQDLFLSTSIGTSFGLGPVKVGVQAPLRFRAYDFRTRQTSFQLRKEDWDEPSDYLKILRYVQYGEPKESVYARLGELSGTTLGHGTIVNGYYNSVDVDHWQTGLRFNVNGAPGGVETMLNSISSPRLLGARLHVRPWYLVDKCSVLNRVAIGFSGFGDTAAPTTTAGATVDAANNLKTPTRGMSVGGVDAEVTVFANALFDLTPYADFNSITGAGTGFHGGFLAGLHPPVLSTQARLEYRRLGARYLPGYFDALYEVQKFSFLENKTKLQYLDEGGHGAPKNGYYGELAFSVADAITVAGGYEDYQGPNNGALQLRLVLPEVGSLRVAAYYAKRNFEKFEEIFDQDNALGVLEGRLQLNPFVALIGQWVRQWKLKPDTRTYEVIDSWNVGTQIGFEF